MTTSIRGLKHSATLLYATNSGSIAHTSVVTLYYAFPAYCIQRLIHFCSYTPNHFFTCQFRPFSLLTTMTINNDSALCDRRSAMVVSYFQWISLYMTLHYLLCRQAMWSAMAKAYVPQLIRHFRNFVMITRKVPTLHFGNLSF